MKGLTTYFREGRVIFRVTPSGKRVRIATARSAIGAALTLKVLRGEIAGDWRKYL